MLELLRYDHGIYAVDSGYIRPQLNAIHLIVEHGQVAVVDTANNAALPRVLAALQALELTPASVAYVVLTHVHLDHAGGAGAMMQAFPEARLVVHPRGASHMADPARLFAAVQAVYGAAKAERLYGTLLPVPADRILTAGDGYPFDLAGRTLTCLETPGHARHHLCLLDPRERRPVHWRHLRAVLPRTGRGRAAVGHSHHHAHSVRSGGHARLCGSHSGLPARSFVSHPLLSRHRPAAPGR